MARSLRQHFSNFVLTEPVTGPSVVVDFEDSLAGQALAAPSGCRKIRLDAVTIRLTLLGPDFPGNGLRRIGPGWLPVRHFSLLGHRVGAMSKLDATEEDTKQWAKDWQRDPEMMGLVRKCGKLADFWLDTFREFDALVAWAQRIGEENGGRVVEKHFDTIRVEFDEYPERLGRLERDYPGLIILRQAMEGQRAEMEIDLGWGTVFRSREPG
jgi:hypothetical protein